jgi:secreted trypsin-like serine protease
MSLTDKDEVRVILGAHNYYNPEEAGRIMVRSRKYWVHENFSMPLAENDLGIIELPQPVEFSDQIQPIKLMTDENFDANLTEARETIAVISGWGYQNSEYEPAEILQTARMKLLPYSECKKYQGHFVEKMTQNHICAMGYDNRPGHATMVIDTILSFGLTQSSFSSQVCDGDSGSPLVAADSLELIGITSYIKDAENGSALHYNDCRTEIAPAVFIRIPSYLKWISEKTGMKFK